MIKLSTILLFISVLFLSSCKKDDDPTKSESQDVFGKWKVTATSKQAFEEAKYMIFNKDYTYTFYWESIEHSFKHIRKGVFEITETDLIIKDYHSNGGWTETGYYDYSFDGSIMTIIGNDEITCELDETIPSEDEWLLPVNEVLVSDFEFSYTSDLTFDGQYILMASPSYNATYIPIIDPVTLSEVEPFGNDTINLGNIEGICFRDNTLFVSYISNIGLDQFDLQTKSYIDAGINVFIHDVTDICKSTTHLWYCQKGRIINVDLSNIDSYNEIKLNGIEVYSLSMKGDYLYVSTREAIHKCQLNPFKVVESYNYPGVFGLTNDGTHFYANKHDEDNNAQLVKLEL